MILLPSFIVDWTFEPKAADVDVLAADVKQMFIWIFIHVLMGGFSLVCFFNMWDIMNTNGDTPLSTKYLHFRHAISKNNNKVLVYFCPILMFRYKNEF